MPAFSITAFIHHIPLLISVGCLVLVASVIFFTITLQGETKTIVQEMVSLRNALEDGGDRTHEREGVFPMAWDEIQLSCQEPELAGCQLVAESLRRCGTLS